MTQTHTTHILLLYLARFIVFFMATCSLAGQVHERFQDLPRVSKKVCEKEGTTRRGFFLESPAATDAL